MRPVTDSVWNKIPQRMAIIDLALAEPQLSPRELAITYTDRKSSSCLRIQCLAAAQGAGFDHQPGLYPDAGLGHVPAAQYTGE